MSNLAVFQGNREIPLGSELTPGVFLYGCDSAGNISTSSPGVVNLTTKPASAFNLTISTTPLKYYYDSTE
jgi:hypothetical protein